MEIPSFPHFSDFIPRIPVTLGLKCCLIIFTGISLVVYKADNPFICLFAICMTFWRITYSDVFTLPLYCLLVLI
jgi:hypothetical protein